MPESMMRQSMETWLKGECVGIAKNMFLFPAALNSVLDSIFKKEPKSIIMENVNYLLNSIDDLKPIITEEQYRHILSEATEIKSIVEKVKRKLSDGEIIQVLNAVGNTRKILPIAAGEAIVKCQIGKPDTKGIPKLFYTDDRVIVIVGTYSGFKGTVIGVHDVEDSIYIVSLDPTEGEPSMQRLFNALALEKI